MKNFDWFRIVLFILLPVLCFGGEGTLPDIASSPTLVPATSAQYNAVTNALQGHQVMRETTGAVVDNTYDIGRPSSGRPRDLHLGRNLYVAGKQIDLSSIALSSTGITSGAAKASGYPLFLQPGGAGHDYCTVSATATDMIGTIDGAAFTLETDINSDDLALAPATQNLCYVYDSLALADPVWTKTVGEFGHYISVSISGTNILSYGGTIRAYKITNGTDTEVFEAITDTITARLYPLRRGIGGTDRIAYSYGDTITALQQHFVFMDNDLATIDTVTKYPIYSTTEPVAPETGDYWYDSDNKTWKRYSGATWESLGRIYLGMAICDDTDCLWAEPTDFNLPWSNLITDYDFVGYNADIYTLKNTLFKASVSGKDVETNDASINGITFANIEGGFSEAASTWYYLYLDKTGAFTLSPVAPRKKDHRLGWYHPKEYWRCVASFYNNASSNFPLQNINPGTGNMEIDESGCESTHTLESGVILTMGLILPPIAEDAYISIVQTGTSNPQYPLYVKDGYDIQHRFKVGAKDIPECIELRRIENGRIQAYQGYGTYIVKAYPTSYKIDW